MLRSIDELTPAEIASICDHSFLLRPEAFRDVQKQGQSPVRAYERAWEDFFVGTIDSPLRPYAVCVRSENVGYANQRLNGTEIKIASVVGFPQRHPFEYTLFETCLAIESGAQEIDMVLDYDRLKSGDERGVGFDIHKIRSIAKDARLKLIFEVCELDPKQIERTCYIAQEEGVDMVKTSTGFGSGGATIEALEIMRDHFSRGIKISGGANINNFRRLLKATSRDGNQIDLDPLRIRIGETGLLKQLQQ